MRPSLAKLLRNPQPQSFWLGLYEDELGATMADYAVLLALVSVGLVAAIGAMSTQITAVFNAVAGGLGMIQN